MYPINADTLSWLMASKLQTISIAVSGVIGALTLTQADILPETLKVDRVSTNGRTIEIGVADTAELTFLLDNHDHRFDYFKFEGAVMTPIVMVDGTPIPLGIFTVDQVPKKLDRLKIVALDYMAKTNKAYAGTLAYPATLSQILVDVCYQCNIAVGSLTFPNSTYTVTERPVDITCHEVVGYVAELAGRNAFVDWTGDMQIAWYTDAGTTPMTNLITNGNFVNTTGWTPISGTGSTSANVYALTGDGAEVSPRVLATVETPTVGHKYYIKVRGRVTNAVCMFIYALVGGVNPTFVSSPTQNTWYNCSAVSIAVSTDTYIGFYQYYADAATANGKVMELQYALAIDLTAAFGAGNEPTAAQMDAYLLAYAPTTSWFDGSANISTHGLSIGPDVRYDGFVIAESDVTITGIKYVDQNYLAGTDAYTLVIEDNPLLQGNWETVVNNIFTAIGGFTYRPFQADTLSFPHIWAMDIVADLIDAQGVSHVGIITNHTFTLNGKSKLLGVGEPEVANGYASAAPFTARQKTILKTVAALETSTQLSPFAQSILHMNEQAASSYGLFTTIDTLPDGSVINYWHDESTLEASMYIRMRSDAGEFTTITGWNAGNPVWLSAWDAQGDAVFRYLAAKGINADYLTSGQVNTNLILVGAQTLTDALAGLSASIAAVSGGGTNFLQNSAWGTYDNPSLYRWYLGITWQLLEKRIDSWAEFEANIATWTAFEAYTW